MMRRPWTYRFSVKNWNESIEITAAQTDVNEEDMNIRDAEIDVSLTLSFIVKNC